MFIWLKKFLGFFRKKELPKALDKGKNGNLFDQSSEKKNEFLKSLKVSEKVKKEKTSVKTLVCYGDGTGVDNTVEF